MFWPGHTSQSHRIHRAFSKKAAWKAKSARRPSGTRPSGTLGEQGIFLARPRCPGIESRLSAVHFSLSRPLLFAKVLCFLWLLEFCCDKTLKNCRFFDSEVAFDLPCVGDRKTWKNEVSKSLNTWWNLALFAASERQNLAYVHSFSALFMRPPKTL